MTPTLADIQAAREAIRTSIRETPVLPSGFLERLTGVPVLLKCEQLQRTGSFKIRGATNFVLRLSPEDAARGLVAASAGNHAQGVALAGSSRGISVTVVMPVTAPLAKVNATVGYGARVVQHGASLEEARTEARAIAAREGRIYVPPFDDNGIIAGQGTVGLEIFEQAPDVEELLVPAGGGGLLAGIAIAMKALKPAIRVVGVQTMAMNGIQKSRAAGHALEIPHARTVADGAAVAGPSERTFALIEQHVDEIVACSEEAIAHAMVLLIERSKLIVEGAGALAVAALQSGVYRPKGPTVAVLSGGNIDINLLGSIVRRGLVDAGRYQHLVIELSDVPGELGLVASVIGAASANILEVEHNREARGLPIGVAVVDLLLEVNGAAHFDADIRALREHGLRGISHGPARLATEDARSRRR